MGRLQRAAGRRPAPARPKGHRHPLLHRRPLCRRHPFQGRRTPDRELRLGRDNVLLFQPPARSRDRRRPLAGDVAGTARGQRHAARQLARTPHPRRLLAPRLGLRGLVGHRGRDPRHRRLERRLQERGTPDRREPPRPGQGHPRPLDSQVPPHRPARARRLPAGGAALVGPLAEGHRHRGGGRPGDAPLPDGQPAPGPPSPPGPRRASRQRPGTSAPAPSSAPPPPSPPPSPRRPPAG